MKSKWLKYRFTSLLFFFVSLSKFVSLLLSFLCLCLFSVAVRTRKKKLLPVERKELLCRLLLYLNVKYQSIEQTNWFVSDFYSSSFSVHFCCCCFSFIFIGPSHKRALNPYISCMIFSFIRFVSAIHPMLGYSYFARYIFQYWIRCHWTMVCSWAFDADTGN